MFWKKESFKNFALPAILAAALLVASFGLGVFVGSHRSNSAAVNSIVTSASDRQNLETFWKVWDVLNTKFVGEAKPTDKEKIYGAIQGLASSYKDPYTVFFPPVESKSFGQQVSGSFEGVGMEVGLKDNTLVVISPLKGTPAERAGVLPGDYILKIDDKDTTGLAVDQAVNLIRGPHGTTVKLTIARKGEKAPREIPIIRDFINIPTTKTELRRDGVFVISLYNFSAISSEKFRDALRQFVESGTDKLIIDLRNNPGGYLEAANYIASWFLPAGDVVVSEDYGPGKEKTYHRASSGQNIFNEKLHMIVLINGGSASASEILAGALHDHGRAKLVGEKSFGKGSVQELVNLPDNTSLKVTIARWLTPNGVSISHNGITPDVVVPMSQDDFLKKGDIQLEKAAEILDKETATSSGAWILNIPQMTVH